jgi:signal transduction histidine kinase
VRQALEAGQTDIAVQLVDGLSVAADAEVRALRRYVRRLRNPGASSAAFSLPDAVNRLCERFSAASGIRVDAAIDGASRLDARVADEVLLLLAEGLSNVRRHTAASEAHVRVAAEGEHVRVEIEDDGPAHGASGEFCPRSISERAEALGGNLEVHQLPGVTAVRVQIPL